MKELECLFLIIFLIIILVIQAIMIAVRDNNIESLSKIISNLIDDNVNLYAYYLEHRRKEKEPFEEFNQRSKE